MFRNFFLKIFLLRYNVEKFGRTRQANDDNIIRRIRFVCHLTKATDTYSKYEGWNFNSGNYLLTTDT